MPDKDDKTLLDSLDITENPKHFKDGKLGKKIAFGAAGAVLLAGVGAGVVNHNMNADKPKDNTSDKQTDERHAEDPYKGISEAKTKQIQKATKSVDKVLTERIGNTKNDDDVKAANTAISDIKGNDNDTQDIRKAYESVMTVVNGSSNDKLQVARSRIANLSNAKLSKELESKFTDKMVNITAVDTSSTPHNVYDETKPLTKAQLKAKEDEMAKNEAKDKADNDAQVKNAQSASSEDANNQQAWSSNPTVTPESTAPTTNTQSTGQTSTNNVPTSPAATQQTTPTTPSTNAPASHAASFNTTAQHAASSIANNGINHAAAGTDKNPVNADTGTQAPNGTYFDNDGWGR